MTRLPYFCYAFLSGIPAAAFESFNANSILMLIAESLLLYSSHMFFSWLP